MERKKIYEVELKNKLNETDVVLKDLSTEFLEYSKTGIYRESIDYLRSVPSEKCLECEKLESISLHDKIVKIDSKAFYGCKDEVHKSRASFQNLQELYRSHRS